MAGLTDLGRRIAQRLRTRRCLRRWRPSLPDVADLPLAVSASLALGPHRRCVVSRGDPRDCLCRPLLQRAVIGGEPPPPHLRPIQKHERTMVARSWHQLVTAAGSSWSRNSRLAVEGIERSELVKGLGGAA